MFLRIYPFFGMFGTGTVILAVFISALFYKGREDERFSLLNHFISELGELGVSRAAWLFNSGLILGGLSLLPYVIGLGLQLNSLTGWLGTAMGILAALGVTAVGIFPMNRITAHGRAAITYFRAGLAMVLFFGLAIAFQPMEHRTVPLAANFLSLLAFAAYAAFLVRMARINREKTPEDAPDSYIIQNRPRLWLFPILEWAVFFATILWMLGMTFFL
jgi:hypothetical membrane protein